MIEAMSLDSGLFVFGAVRERKTSIFSENRSGKPGWISE